MMGRPMPSPIGHALGGVAAIWTAERLPASHEPPRTSVRLTLVCAALAVSPDLDLLYQPIHRTATHSVTAIVLVMIIAAGVTGWVNGRIDWRATLLCGLAYASHIALDWLGADPTPPQGLQILWPFSQHWFIAPWTIFPGTERRTIFSAAAILTNLRAAVVELVLLGPIVAWLGARRSAIRKVRERQAVASQAEVPQA